MVVRLSLIAALIAAPLAADVSPTASAQPVTYTVSPIAVEENFSRNHPVEDFFVVSLVSVPFVALWTLVGATAVAGISQKKFPPEFSDATLISTAAIAVGTSFSIGLVSVFWGKGQVPKK